jgi:hypothetical protein
MDRSINKHGKREEGGTEERAKVKKEESVDGALSFLPSFVSQKPPNTRVRIIHLAESRPSILYYLHELRIVTAFFFFLFLKMAKNKCFFGCCFLVAIFRQILLKSHPDLFLFLFYKFR